MRKKKIAAAALTVFCCLFAVFPVFATNSSLDTAKKKKTAIEQEKKRAETAKAVEAFSAAQEQA